MTELTINSIAEFGQTVADNIGRVIVGTRREVYLILTALLSGGHVLLEDVPGWARRCWRAGNPLATVRRIQCTPTFCPRILLSVGVQPKQGDFVFHPRIMAQVV